MLRTSACRLADDHFELGGGNQVSGNRLEIVVDRLIGDR